MVYNHSALVCILSIVCSFHAAAGLLPTPFGDNNIYGSERLTQQGGLLVLICVHVSL